MCLCVGTRVVVSNIISAVTRLCLNVSVAALNDHGTKANTTHNHSNPTPGRPVVVPIYKSER